MKTQYKKVRQRGDAPGQYAYSHAGAGYHRCIRTFPELRERAYVLSDKELRDLGITPRMGRSHKVLDPWNDFSITRNYGRSWKDFTKHRKQWGVGFDPKVTPDKPTPFMQSMFIQFLKMGGDPDAWTW